MAEPDAATAASGVPPAPNPPPAAITGQPGGASAPTGAPAGFDADFPAPAASSSSFDQDFPQQAPSALPSVPMSVPEWKSYLRNTPSGRVISAFGDAWTEPGLTEQTQDWLRKAGMTNVLPDADERTAGFGQGVARRFANAIRGANRDFLAKPLLTATAAFDIVAKTIQGGIEAVGQAGHELQEEPSAADAAPLQPGAQTFLGKVETALNPLDVIRKPAGALMQEAAGAAEMWATWGHLIPGGGPRLPQHVAESRAAAVIGEGEGGYMNTRQPSDADVIARASAQAEAAPPPGEPVSEREPQAAAEAAPGEPAAAPSIHDVARQVDPDLIGKRDALEARRADYQRWMGELSDARERNLTENPPDDLKAADERIADLERKRDNAGARTRGRWEKEIEDAQTERDAIVDRVRSTDTRDMAQVRRDLVNTTHALWDLGPDLRRVYDEAASRMPPEPEPVAEAPGAPEGVAPDNAVQGAAVPAPPSEAAPGAQTEPTGERSAAAPPELAKPPRSVEEQVAQIQGDVAKKLTAVGQDAEVARSAAAVVAQYYATRAERFGGALGSAQEMYEREMPEVRLGRQRQPAAVMAQELEQAAYHGSPHIFDQFTLDHIGKGEGHQAFGHGLYFAGNKAVAKYYREALTKRAQERRTLKVDGVDEERNPDSLKWYAIQRIEKLVPLEDTEFVSGVDTYGFHAKQIGAAFAKSVVEADAKAELQAAFEKHMKRLIDDTYPDERPSLEKMINAARETIDHNIEVLPAPKGRLYHVELAPEADHWLDWDKPLNEQSPRVREALKHLGHEYDAEGMRAFDDALLGALKGDQPPGPLPKQPSNPTGEDIYKKLAADPARASEILKEAGIPGIRYRDNGSRDIRILRPEDSTSGKWVVGERTGKNERFDNEADARKRYDELVSHNFVVFDPGDITIKEFEQSRRGKIDILANGRRIITLMRDADASTFMHETGHMFLEDLIADAGRAEAPEQLKADAETALKWMGTTREDFLKTTRTGRRAAAVVRGHERWARGFERYLMEGVAPSRALARVFAQFRKWLTGIYQTVSKLRTPVNDDIRDVFDRLLAKEPERVTIAPDRELASGIADLHEADAHEASGAEAETALDRAHTEAADHVDAQHPELRDALALDREANAGAAQRPGDDGQGAGPGAVGGEAGGVPGAGAVVPGTGRTGPEGFGPPRPAGFYGPPKKLGLYAKVPKRPPSLADWIKSKGGVKDDKGEVKALGVKKPGLIKATGASLDDLALRAWEQGYFPEWSERPTENDLIRKLDEDLHGNHQWSEHHADLVQEYRDALARNEDVDRLAAELDINEKGMSYEAFWDKVAERLSEQHRDREVESQLDADMQVAAEEARGQSHEYDAEVGRQGVSEQEAGASGPGGAAGPERPGGGAAGGDDQSGAPGAAGPGAGGVEEGQGQGGGAAGAEGGNKPPRVARNGDDDLVDKAGNIRLDLLNAPDDVDAALRQIAIENNDFAADRFGTEGKQLHDQILAARVLVKRLGDDMAEKMRGAAAPDADEAALAAYRESANRLTMAARRLATLTHSWGLAGQAFRELHGLPDSAAALTMRQLAERTKGMTFNQLRQEAQLTMGLDTDAQRVRFLDQTRSTGWQRARAMYIEYFVNNLISGPLTHAAYSIGNNTMNLWRGLVEMPAAAGVSALRGRGAGARIYASETKALIYSYTVGALDGWSAAVKAFKTDTTQLLPGEMQSMTPREREAWQARNGPMAGAIPGPIGTAVRLPSRSVKAIHAFGRGIGYAHEIYRRGIRSGLDAGLEGDALNTHVARYLESPPVADMEAASTEATSGVQMQTAKYGSAFWHIKQAVDKNVVAKTIAPFMQIGANLLHGAFIDRTPLGFLDSGVRDDLMGKNGAVRQDTAVGKMISGIALSTGVIGGVVMGRLTGGGPNDYKERSLMMAQGWQPYSIRIGDRWVPYRKYLGALGPLVAGVADMAEISHKAKEGDYLNAAWSAVGGLAEVVADESWMRGVSNFVGAVRNYDTPVGERYLRDLAMDFVPYHVGMSQTARLVDDYSRRVTGWVSAFKSGVPGLSQQLPPRYDVIGRPVSSHIMISPTKIDNDPVLGAMREAQFYPASVPKKIRGVDLTDAQYDEFSRLAGTYARQHLEPLVNSDGWGRIPLHVRHNIIHDAFLHERERARQVIIAKSAGGPNDVWQQSLQSKKAKLRALDEPPIE